MPPVTLIRHGVGTENHQLQMEEDSQAILRVTAWLDIRFGH